MRTVFISDLHLGSRYAQTKAIYEVLKKIDKEKPEKVYLVGDIIDGWAMKRGGHWDHTSWMVVRKILSLVKHGAEVTWVIGNHDEFAREILEFNPELGNIELCNECIHETADGKRILITHGDLFDPSLRLSRWVNWVGCVSYDTLLFVNHWLSKVQGLFLPHGRQWSISKAAKAGFKQAVNFVTDFEKCLAQHAAENDCDGIVCGHVHVPAIKEIDAGKDKEGNERSVMYHNCGDWIESCTYLFENKEGGILMYRYVGPEKEEK